jgi:hypothetical protein
VSARPACAPWEASIAAFVLGALEPAESAALERHLAGCAVCEAERRRLAVIPPLLDLAGEGGEASPKPPAGLEDALVARLAERPAPATARPAGRRWRRAVPVLGGVLTGAAIAAAVVSVWPASVSALSYPLVPTAVAPGARAEARLTPTTAGTSVRLRVHGLPQTGPDRAYELRFQRPGDAMTAGTFRVGPGGSADVQMTTAAGLGEYRLMRVVLVPRGAGPGAPGVVVLTGRL